MDLSQPGAHATPPVGGPPPDATASGSIALPALRGRDLLTGLLDCEAFEEVLGHEDARERRYRRPSTVVIFQLDGLDRLAERLGRAAADRVEPALADTMSRLARRADYVARLEPGRFGALLPETDEILAINYVERVRHACETWLETSALAVRLSIGWASTEGDSSIASIVRTATQRMLTERRRHEFGAGS
jgi:diguanylate cyclase (GGDEF)-like protein